MKVPRPTAALGPTPIAQMALRFAASAERGRARALASAEGAEADTAAWWNGLAERYAQSATRWREVAAKHERG